MRGFIPILPIALCAFAATGLAQSPPAPAPPGEPLLASSVCQVEVDGERRAVPCDPPPPWDPKHIGAESPALPAPAAQTPTEIAEYLCAEEIHGEIVLTPCGSSFVGRGLGTLFEAAGAAFAIDYAGSAPAPAPEASAGSVLGHVAAGHLALQDFSCASLIDGALRPTACKTGIQIGGGAIIACDFGGCGAALPLSDQTFGASAFGSEILGSGGAAPGAAIFMPPDLLQPEFGRGIGGQFMLAP